MRWYAVVVLALFAVGCGHTPIIEDQRTFEAPFDEVWGATAMAVEQKGLSIAAREKEKGRLTTDSDIFGRGSKDIDEVAIRPSVFFPDWSGVRYQFDFDISRTEEGHTAVSITSNIDAYETIVTRRWHECRSNGTLEKDFFDRIMKILDLEPEESSP